MNRLKQHLVLAIVAVTLAGDAMGDLFTGREVTASEARRMMQEAGVTAPPAMAGTHYAIIRQEELPAFHAVVRYRLSKSLGIGWDERFNCWSLCWHWVDQASQALARESFHRALPAPDSKIRPGVFPMSHPDNRREGYHGTLVLLTDSGVVFWDTATGRANLTQSQITHGVFPGA